MLWASRILSDLLWYVTNFLSQIGFSPYTLHANPSIFFDPSLCRFDNLILLWMFLNYVKNTKHNKILVHCIHIPAYVVQKDDRAAGHDVRWKKILYLTGKNLNVSACRKNVTLSALQHWHVFEWVILIAFYKPPKVHLIMIGFWRNKWCQRWKKPAFVQKCRQQGGRKEGRKGQALQIIW